MKNFFKEYIGTVFFIIWVVFMVTLITFIVFMAKPPKPKPLSKNMSISFESYVKESIKRLEELKEKTIKELNDDTKYEKSKIKALLADSLTYQAFLKSAKNEEAKKHLKEKIKETKEWIKFYQRRIDNKIDSQILRKINKKIEAFKKMSKDQKEEK